MPTDEELIAKLEKFRADGIEHTDFERMKKNEGYANGLGMWDSYEKQHNKDKGKFCLSIPLIRPMVAQLSGIEVQNPKDPTVNPIKNASSFMANLLSALIKHTLDLSYARFKHSDMFESANSISTAYMVVIISDDEEDANLKQIDVKNISAFESILDPSCSVYNINDKDEGAKFFIWEPWIDKEKIEAQYPKKAADLKAMGSNSGSFVMGQVNAMINWLTGRGTNDSRRFSYMSEKDVNTVSKYRYPVNHTWWREPKKCFRWYDNNKPDTESVLLLKDDEIKNAKAVTKGDTERYTMKEVICDVVHHTIRVGSVLLEDRIDELNGVLEIPIFRYSPFFASGISTCVVDDSVGTQDEINWLHSMKLNIIKTLANSGWKFRGGSGNDDAFEDFLEDHGGEDNIIINESLGNGSVEKIKPNEYPVAMGLAESEAKENLKTISGIRTEDPSSSDDQSGKAILAKQNAAITGNGKLYQNYDHTLTLMADVIVKVLRNNPVYSLDEIKEVVALDEILNTELMNDAREQVVAILKDFGAELPPPAQPPNLQAMAPELQQQAIQDFQEDTQRDQRISQAVDQMAFPIAELLLIDELKMITKGRYNTKVTLSTSSATHRMAEASEIFELNRLLIESGHLPLDRESLIESTDVANKQALIDRGRQQQQQLAANTDQLSVGVSA